MPSTRFPPRYVTYVKLVPAGFSSAANELETAGNVPMAAPAVARPVDCVFPAT